MKTMKFFHVFVISNFLVVTLSESKFQCYSCAWNAGEPDVGCLNDPASVVNGILECDKKYCYSIRIEEKKEISSIYRTCIDDPLYINKMISYDDFRIYYLACTENLCNSGSGREIYTTTGSGTIYVPGLGSGANNLTISSLSIIFAFSLINFITSY